MLFIRTLTLAFLVGSAGLALAKDQGALKDLLQDDLVAEGWIYEDIDEGYRRAETTGKPLLICFSCVP